MKRISKLFLAITLMGWTACQNNEEALPTLPGVEEAVVSYVQRFESEADLRGVAVDFDNLEVRLTDVDGENVIGQCITYSDGSREVVLDRDFWEESNEFGKEMLVFHELGHCILGRGHDESRNADGTCSSIMHSGTSGCRFNYNSLTRKGYLDELFGD